MTSLQFPASKSFHRLILSALIATMTVVSFAQAMPTQPTAAEIDSRRWFQDAKFGLFIHWGIYSELGAGEWVMETHKIPIHDYEKLAPQFYPVRYDPVKWVAVAKAAGMKYITITTRHHDGFSMFKTRQTDWNIVDRTPYAKDPIRMLADECHRQGIKLFFYYSQLDWHNPVLSSRQHRQDGGATRERRLESLHRFHECAAH
jgi:alpha-L-fucosidase